MERREQQDKQAAEGVVLALPAVGFLAEPLRAVAAEGQAEVSDDRPRRKPRTTYTLQQKERLRDFAENLGWKMDRHRSVDIDRFCHSIGVSRVSFRTWMYNNRNTSFAPMESMNPSRPSGSGGGNIASSSPSDS